MDSTKHIRSRAIGALILGALIVAAFLVNYAVTRAQGEGYSQAVSLSTGQLTVEQGAIVDFTGTVAANSNNPGPETITASVSTTPAATCTINPSTSVSLPAGQSQSFMISCRTSSATPLGNLTATLQISAAHLSNYQYATASVNVIAPTAAANACTSLTLTLANGKTSYEQGESVNYTYTCVPAGTRAASTTVQVVDQSGSATTYNSGTNIDTAGLGFSTSNLPVGNYTLRVCFDPACSATSYSTSAAFSVTGTATITLYGTIFRDGQYIDPATGSLRNCVSPNAWMKEVATNYGARGFHCMPNYTPTATDAPPTSCAGTLWAGSSFQSDTCGTTAPSTSTTTGTCASGQVWCPAVAGSSSPAGCYTTCPTASTTTTGGTSVACENGARCSNSSWCNNGSQCYYPNGDLTCVAWPTPTGATAAPMMNAECPSGTSECSPTDTNCVASGQTVPYVSGKWCRNSQQYYSTDGTQMTCVKPGAAIPAGLSSCRPDDTNCITTGGYGSSSGWCSMGQQCYQTSQDSNANNDKYCAPYIYGSGGDSVNCPAGYSVCSPTDTGCKQKGDTWTDSGTSTSYWCSNSKKCSTTNGGLCVGWQESCPAGTKYCSATDTNCIEPGEEKTFTSTTQYPWCGGGGMTFYSPLSTGGFKAKCVSSPSSTTGVWDPNWKPTVPAGYQFCRPSDTNCIEPGTTGPSTGWCAWMTPGTWTGGSPGANGATTRTCPALEGYTPPGGIVPPPPPATCPAGQISCPNPAGTGAFCTTATVCPDRPRVCPAMPDVTYCPAGQTVKKITTADGCTNTYCETDFQAQPVCKEGEGFTSPPIYDPTSSTASSSTPFYAPACRIPYWCWEGSAWVQKPEPTYGTAGTAGAPAYNNLCSTFRVEELDYKTAWAKKWNPKEFGAWYWPNYPAGTPSYRYDGATDSLVSCKYNEPMIYKMTPMYPSEYQSPCQQMPEEDKPVWLVRFRSEKKMAEAWNRRKPEPRLCAQVISYAQDASGKCKAFPTPCDVPKGWSSVPSCDFTERVCPAIDAICGPGQQPEVGSNGCITGRCVGAGQGGETCRVALRGYYDEVRGHRFFLRDIARQITEAPEVMRASLSDVKEIVAKGEKLATAAEEQIKQVVKSGKCDNTVRDAINEKLQVLRTDIMPALNESQGALRVTQECRFFTKGIDERISMIKNDAARFERQGDKEFALTLREYIGQFEALKPKAQAACKGGAASVLDDLRFEFRIVEEGIGDLFAGRRTVIIDDYRDNYANGILSGIDYLRRAIIQQNLATQCQKVDEYLDTVTKLIDEQKFTEAESFSDIVFDAAKQCGVRVDFIGDVNIDHRVLFEGISGIDEATIDRLVERIVKKTTAKVELLLNEKIAGFLTDAKLMQEKAIGQLATSVDNVQAVLKTRNEELMNQVLTAKEDILVQVNASLEALKLNQRRIALSNAQRTELERAIETAAVGVWCGDYREQVQQKLMLAKQALEAGSITSEDVASLDSFMREAQAGNPESCFDEGVSDFKDTPPEQWFFKYFHGPEAIFKGKFDAKGRALGLVEPGLQTRWMEGGMVVGRALGIRVDGQCAVPSDIPGAANVPYGACALNYFADNNVPLPAHPVHEYMTRGELAMLITSLVGDKLPLQGNEAHLEGYTDVRFDTPFGRAVATMIANKIMLGKDPTNGKFVPASIPSRAELAASIGRLLELLDLTASARGSAPEGE